MVASQGPSQEQGRLERSVRQTRDSKLPWSGVTAHACSKHLDRRMAEVLRQPDERWEEGQKLKEEMKWSPLRFQTCSCEIVERLGSGARRACTLK